MVNKMKKILIFLILILVAPIYISLKIKDEKIKNEEKINIISNQLVRVKREKLNRIDTMTLEEYVKGVVSAEMPISFDLEALKAQAVCARSYVLKKINNSKEYDVVDTVSNQVYQDDFELKKKWKNDYEKNYNKLKQAVTETSGEYMTYNGKIIETFFFSTSNGYTENSEEVFVKSLPYLRSVESSWDSEVSPVFNYETQMSLLDFYNKLNLKYNKKLEYKILEKTKGESVKTIEINKVKFKGTDVRKKLNIRSTDFYFEVIGNNVIIKTKGYGHGVGMSQYGALAMSKKGYKYDEILKYYFKGIEISK